jgi:hypothetical protein
MKENTEQLKGLLLKALASTPNDFSLGEAKSLITRAIESVASVEAKRTKREASLQERRQAKSITIQNPVSAWQAIQAELAMERRKLEEIRGRRGRPKTSQEEGEELNNVFG